MPRAGADLSHGGACLACDLGFGVRSPRWDGFAALQHSATMASHAWTTWNGPQAKPRDGFRPPWTGMVRPAFRPPGGRLRARAGQGRADYVVSRGALTLTI